MKFRVVIVVIVNIAVSVCVKLNIEYDYKQAVVPPLVSVVFDVPQYGRKELFKFYDYIKDNLKIIRNEKGKMLHEKEKYENEIIKEEYMNKVRRKVDLCKCGNNTKCS
jgi:hypothetical protein